MPSGLTSTSSWTVGARRISDCSGVKDMLPRPWYERVQSIAGTPSISGGASERPSVSERLERASLAAASAELLRWVGTGGSVAGKDGVTVRWAAAAAARADVVVDEAAGFAGAAVVDAVVEGLAVEVVVAGAALAEDTQAVRDAVEEMLRCDIRYAEGAARDDADAVRRAEKPLRADVVAIVMCVWICRDGG
jgi:hypothetical protein